MGKWVRECEYKYDAKELAYILYHYSDYCVGEDKINLLSWAKSWELIIDTKVDFDYAVKSLSPRKQRFIQLIMEGWTEYKLEGRGFYKAKKFKWSILEEMARTLNGNIKNET